MNQFEYPLIPMARNLQPGNADHLVTPNKNTMSSHRRKFTTEEKMDILQQAKQAGVTAVLRKHNLSYSVFHRWKDKLIEKGKSDDTRASHVQVHTKMKELVEENTLLKKIIANQAMLLELKEEELRKNKV